MSDFFMRIYSYVYIIIWLFFVYFSSLLHLLCVVFIRGLCRCCTIGCYIVISVYRHRVNEREWVSEPSNVINVGICIRNGCMIVEVVEMLTYENIVGFYNSSDRRLSLRVYVWHTLVSVVFCRCLKTALFPFWNWSVDLGTVKGNSLCMAVVHIHWTFD